MCFSHVIHKGHIFFLLHLGMGTTPLLTRDMPYYHYQIQEEIDFDNQSTDPLYENYCSDEEKPCASTRSGLISLKESFMDRIHGLNEASKGYLSNIFKKDDQPEEVIHVYRSGTLHEGEGIYLASRQETMRTNMQKFLQKTLPEDKKCPTVALCFSGGGYRTMLTSLACLSAADTVGLIDAATYTTGLSGSCWAQALAHSLNMNYAELITYLSTRINTSLFSSSATLYALYQSLHKRVMGGKKISLVDVYGGLIYQKLFSPDIYPIPQLHEQLNDPLKRKLPYPIYTSIFVKSPHTYGWMEYTPHAVGSTCLDYFIPTAALGRFFFNGSSVSPEDPRLIPQLLGIWGSAISASIQEMYQHTKELGEETNMKRTLSLMTRYKMTRDMRFTCAKIPNFTFGLHNAPLTNHRYLQVLDAGLHFNIPIVPLLRKDRAVDVIIVVDASSNKKIGLELHKAKLYALKQQLPFPPFDKKQLENNPTCIVCKSEDRSTPTIIYIPLIKNETYSPLFDPQESCANGYCQTSNFIYTPEQIQELTGLAMHNFIASIPTIRQEIAAYC